MLTHECNPWFEPYMEITIGVIWISIIDLPPNFFVKESIFSIALAVGKLMIMDLATKNQIKPSCTKVKIKTDLVAKLPQRVKINKEMTLSEKSSPSGLKSNIITCQNITNIVAYKDMINIVARQFTQNYLMQNKKRCIRRNEKKQIQK